MNAVHLRLVFPEDFRGKKHAGNARAIYVTLPGREEVALPGVTAVRAAFDIEDAARVDLSLVCSLEVEYSDEET